MLPNFLKGHFPQRDILKHGCELQLKGSRSTN